MAKTVTVEEAAKLLGIQKDSVRQLIFRGRLIGIKVPPSLYRGEWYVYKESIIEYQKTRGKRNK